MRAYGRLQHLFLVLIAGLVGLSATLAVDIPAHAAAGGSISGIVTDQHGEPIQGASVRAGLVTDPVDGPLISTTGADGRYELTGVPNGSFHVAFAIMQAGQMKGSYYSNALTREDPTPVVVDGGATTGIDQVVDTGASISGTVIFGLATGLQGCTG